MNRPQPHEQSSWSNKYTDLVTGDVLETLDTQAQEFSEFLSTITHLADYAYAPGKWTLKELLGHILDTERILVYRLLCIARGEQQPLPGFEEDDYVAVTNFSVLDFEEMIDEFKALRKANMFFFRSLTGQDLDRIGTSWIHKISARALLWVCAGHIIHHTNIIKERYL